jgi:hypothetical protein
LELVLLHRLLDPTAELGRSESREKLKKRKKMLSCISKNEI